MRPCLLALSLAWLGAQPALALGDASPRRDGFSLTLGAEFGLDMIFVANGEGERAVIESGNALLSVELTILPWLSLLGKLGFASLVVDQADFDGDAGLSGGGGLRVRILEFLNGSLKIGLSGQVIYHHHGDVFLQKPYDADYIQYMASAGMSYRQSYGRLRGHMVYYGGATFSQLFSNLTSAQNDIAFQLRDAFPAFAYAGLDYSYSDYLHYGLEIQGGNQLSVLVNISVNLF